MDPILQFSDVWAIMPIVLVSLTGLVMVIIDAIWNDSPAIPTLAVTGVVAAMVWELTRLSYTGTAFQDMIFYGGFASYVNLVILVSTLFSVILSVPYLNKIKHAFGEVHALIIFAAVGMMVLGSANNLILVFVGLETMSICLYVLTGLVRENAAANESALKYFLLGAFSTGFFLYGIALMYGATGTMYLHDIALGFEQVGRPVMFWAGVGLLLIGFFFKIGAVPFHMWTPDAYHGAPTTLTGFMATGSKTAAFASLVLVLYHALDFGVEQWQQVLVVIAVLTMVLGNVVALVQRNVKRMLAYSAVAHAGYVLTGLAAGTTAGYSGALYYLAAYTLMNIGAFGVMALLEWDDQQGRSQTLDSLAGIGYRKPMLGTAMAIFMFSLIGFPPLAGFIGKYKVFAAAISADLTWLAIIGVVTSVISAGYYLRVPVYFWMRSQDEQPTKVQNTSFTVPGLSAMVLVVCVVGLLWMGVLPSPVLDVTGGFFVEAATAIGP